MKVSLIHSQRFCKAAIAVLLLCSLTPYAPFSNFLSDIPSHFILQYAIGCLVLGTAALWLRLGRFYFFCLALAFTLNMNVLAPYLDRHDTAALPPQTIKVLQANVLTQNRNAALLAKLIADQQPDIIVLAEINDAFRKLAADIKPHYPAQTMRHKVAVFSRLPAADISPAQGRYAAAHISALTVTWQGQTIDIVTLHTPTPLQDLRKRDAALTEAADFIRTRPNPVIFAGDINASPWCPAVQNFTAATGLISARRHHGILPSWPQWLPASFLRLPIDHVFADQSLKAHDLRLAVPIGSDHLPTIGIFSLAGAQQADK